MDGTCKGTYKEQVKYISKKNEWFDEGTEAVPVTKIWNQGSRPGPHWWAWQELLKMRAERLGHWWGPADVRRDPAHKGQKGNDGG
jgi:hypothetical protein